MEVRESLLFYFHVSWVFCLYIGLCTTCRCCPQRPKEGFRSPGTVVTYGGFEWHCGCLICNQGLSKSRQCFRLLSHLSSPICRLRQKTCLCYRRMRYCAGNSTHGCRKRVRASFATEIFQAICQNIQLAPSCESYPSQCKVQGYTSTLYTDTQIHVINMIYRYMIYRYTDSQHDTQIHDIQTYRSIIHRYMIYRYMLHRYTNIQTHETQIHMIHRYMNRYAW